MKNLIVLAGYFASLGAAAADLSLVKRAVAPSDICEIGKAKGSVCNKAGSLATPQTLRILHFDDDLGCIDALNLANRAQSASYQGTTGNCTLYKATLAKQGYTQSPTPNLRFFDKSCLKCRACTLGFANGDFETGDLKPWGSMSYPFGGNEFILSEPGYKGSKYAAKSEQSQAGQPGNGVSALFTSVLAQSFEACIGTTYDIKAFVKGNFQATDTDNQHYLRVYINNQAFETAATTIDQFKQTYQIAQFAYKANEHFPQLVFSASMSLNRNTSASFTVWVDSVTVTPRK